jgi:hypothetical protein
MREPSTFIAVRIRNLALDGVSGQVRGPIVGPGEETPIPI